MDKSRREALKQGVTLATGLGLAGSYGNRLFAIGKKTAPSDRVNLALIGCRNRGYHVLENHLKLADTKCVALCDVDSEVLEKRSAEIKEKYGQKPKVYTDYRKMLENKDIDAVIIGTPDHWHCLQLVHACEAGKDVYVEKPMANSIEECNVMVNATRKYKRVVQVGQQQRSSRHWQEIMKTIQSTKLGKLRKVEMWANFNYGVGGEKVSDSPVPKSVDYNLWLGPAPKRKTFNTGRFHGNWRMWWDYGGGLMTDWGVHLIDMGLWAGPVSGAPQVTLAYGDNLSFPDHARETYDTMSVTWPLTDYIMTWEHTAGTQNGPFDKPYGIRFICDKATILADRSGYKTIPEWDQQRETHQAEAEEVKRYSTEYDMHAGNFIDCIKSREDPICTVEDGRRVALYAHMANIAVRTGELKLQWDDANNRFAGSDKANQYIAPKYREPWVLPQV
ncbi:MAG: Gfo/Idh/MocA family oxidoreductase [Cyclobacteriaceae bacterium]|nr:Gfo/Idh/MocA family oxidoreductase [Cyclobacteriaceae bacterium]